MSTEAEANDNPDLPNIQRDVIAELQEKYQLIQVPPCAAPVQSFDGSGPRLIITKLVLENFKSYGTRNELGPFCKNFNCIVGPNGSGKSNVIDSLLFVFGYRAAKIRSKKLSTLIHNSQLLPNLPFCRVEVHFQRITDTGEGCMDFREVPDSSFVFSRTGYPDNTGQYHINGVKATTAEVKEKLIGHGIDLTHNRFLILQGEVEQISLMPPKANSPHEEGLLEYLEDIIGSSRFKEPLCELDKRIESLNELRQEKINRLKVVEREKKELEGVRNQALDYLREINKLNLVKNVLYQKYKFRASEDEKHLKEELSKAEEGLTELRITKKELDTKHEAATVEFKTLQKSYEERDKTYQNHKTLFQEIEVEDAKLRDDFKHKRGEITKLKQLVAGIEKKLEEMAKLPEEAQRSIETLSSKMTALQKEKIAAEENYHTSIENLRKATEPLAKEKEVKEKDLNELQKVTDEERGKLELVQSRLDILLSNHKKAKHKFDQIKGDFDRLDQGLIEKRKSLQQLDENLPKRVMSLESVERDLVVVKKREGELAQELKVKQLKVQEMRSNFEQRTGKDRVLDSLLEQRRLGRLPGVIGRLGDLGRIDAKYDVAVSTACGTLDNIVTDTMDTAQACVQFLKDHNIGFATFIALDKMESQRAAMEKRVVTPENAPRLFDLIQFNEERYKTAFYFGMGDTLVANDSNEATRWAYGKQRFRVVTLNGVLIETSGALSGGGNRVVRGKMQLLNARNSLSRVEEEIIDPKELESLEKVVSERSKEMYTVQENRSKLEDAFSTLNREVETMKRQHNALKLEVTHLSQQVTSMESNIRVAEKRVEAAKPDEKETESLRSEISQLEKAYNKAQKSSNSLKAVVDTLTKQIEEKGEVLLSASKSRLNNVETAIKELSEKISKVTVSVKTAERNLKKAEEQKETRVKQLEETRQALEDLQTKLEQLAQTAAEHLDKYQTAQKERDALKEQMTTKSTEIEAMNESFLELNRRVSEVKRSIDQAKEKVDEKVREVRRWSRELSSLKLTRIIEDEEDAQIEQLNDESKMEVENDPQALPTTSTQEMNPLDDNDEDPAEPLEEISVEELVASKPSPYHSRDYCLPKYKRRELMSVKVTQEDVTTIDERIQAMRPNMAAIEEYRHKEQVYLTRVAEMAEVNRLRDAQLQQQSQFKQQRLQEFLNGFHLITDKLKEMYQMITLGGDAELELVDSLDPFSEGVVFSVRPPNKSWKCISNLSGGEKTLSSLALVFALHHYKPTPLYVMDEIDAALDFKNVSIVANYVKERTKNAQFIIISLRNNMFELGNRLVGIYKTYDCSFTCTVDINPLVEVNLQKAIAAMSGAFSSQSKHENPLLLDCKDTENKDQLAHRALNYLSTQRGTLVPKTPHFSRMRGPPVVQSTPLGSNSNRMPPAKITFSAHENPGDSDKNAEGDSAAAPPPFAPILEECPPPQEVPEQNKLPSNSMEDLFDSMEIA